MTSQAPTILSRPQDFQPFIPSIPSEISNGITYGMLPSAALIQHIRDATYVGLAATVLTTQGFTPPPPASYLGSTPTPITTNVGFTETALADIQEIFDAIQALYLSVNTPRDRQIADRIKVLHRDALAEDEHILPASLSQFAKFFLEQPRLGFPRITLTPDGTLRARWIGGPSNFVAIEFTGEPLAKLVAEIPREDNLTATHFSSEPLKNILSVARNIGASFS